MSSRPQSASASPVPKGFDNYELGGSGAIVPATRAASAPTAAPSSGNANNNIDIFLRVRPVQRPSPRLAVDFNENKVEFNIPRDAAAGFVNNQREHYEFRFNGVIGAEAKQDEVFERVARPVVNGALEGFNGTIFAYGQTGSGKTFTITGGPERYADRGIIPRTISTIFSEVTKRSDYQFAVHISYLELYNENGYDLLDPDREVKAMEDLPQVFVMEDEEQRINFRNLTIHRVNNEEEALNLLFLGDTNRTISETPMNQASSRSHCIFTVYIEARKNGEDVVRRSKLNLVDLAGSERVSKTGVDGTTLKEAKFINLSLHYLEQVIIALQERSMGLNRPHIPYRNSMMTTVLKDSLGGNCRTVMVATINSELQQLDESISTCRFAMRVALVRNQVAVNEEMDPSLVIRRLKQEIRELKEEVRLLRGEQEDRGPLTPDELRRLQEQIETYTADNSADATLNLGGSMLFIRAAFDTFRRLLRGAGTAVGALAKLGGGGGAEAGGVAGGGGGGGGATADMMDQIKKLKLQVQQRDNEINILVSMLKRRDGAAPGPGGAIGAGPARPALAAAPTAGLGPGSSMLMAAAGPGAGSMGPSPSASIDASGSGGRLVPQSPARTSGSGGPAGGAASVSSSADDLAVLMNANLLADRNKAFELFRKSYRQNEVIEENKMLLKQKYDMAKNLNTTVHESKNKINEIKALIEQRRVQRAMTEPDATGEDPEEARCKDLIEREKARYKQAFDQLRELKKEIEHLHMILEQSRVRLQRDFEQWMGLMARQQQQASGNGSGPGNAGPASPMHSSAGPSSSMPPPPARTPSRGQLTTSTSGGFVAAPPPAAPKMAWGEAPSPAASTSSVSTRAYGASSPAMSAAAAAEARAAAAVSASTAARQLDFGGVDPAVLEAARPYLTGNPDADRDIIKFYDAKAKLLQKLGQG